MVIPIAPPSGFLSTLSLRRATAFGGLQAALSGDFYPRSPCGERHIHAPNQHLYQHFYPRSPCGERLGRFGPAGSYSPISIHALLAESDVFLLRKITITVDISIHALLAESDPVLHRSAPHQQYFYPRSPCGERPIFGKIDTSRSIFLSTLSLRRATDLEPSSTRKLTFLSTLSLRRATKSNKLAGQNYKISIHALLAESDPKRAEIHASSQQFLSTLSLRRATCYSFRHSASHWHFYPRSPCGERPRQNQNL